MDSWYTAFCQTPLHIAARFGREDLAPVLIAAGADVNARDRRNDRPLHLAAEYGNAAIVRVLLERGADVNAPGAMNRTPLHAAADGLAGTQDADGRLQVARLLIAGGANVNAKTRDAGFTPEWYAEGNKSYAIAELLRASGSRGTDDVRCHYPDASDSLRVFSPAASYPRYLFVMSRVNRAIRLPMAP